MGMAASQARYLALSARKSNTEWEGQQINQARTALANQSANLFNQLLTLEVPTVPDSSDYTEIQYSYSDGSNDSVISSWTQLSSADANYNYIVTHYYYADIYTGSQKKLSDPQVQTGTTVTTTDLSEDSPEISVNYGDNTVQITLSDGTTRTYTSVSVLSESGDSDFESALSSFDEAMDSAISNGTLSTDAVYGWQDSDGTWHFMVQDEIENKEYNDYAVETKPAYVGNSKLTELTELTDEQAAELAQILEDCSDSAISEYLSFDSDGNLVYSGEGIYTFDLWGQTYYTTESDLYTSIQSQADSDNVIDNQTSLAYYNASYIQTKIESTNYALLETDESGRFTSVKFDDDSVVYSLNVETVTDEDAYEDAMNEYYYQQEVYEKAIADINAQTSIIQQEDRTLELRLEQLDTEQNALATEMEAVKKVIDDNIETTFKTFSD